MSLVTNVISWSDRIEDGRQPSHVLLHLNSEQVELWDEYFGVGDGKDGMFGEAIDVILCALDLIRLVKPDLTPEELEAEVEAYAEMKCKKWALNASQKQVLTPQLKGDILGG